MSFKILLPKNDGRNCFSFIFRAHALIKGGRTLKIKPGELKDMLLFILEVLCGASERFRIQRSNLPKAYELIANSAGGINGLTKQGIAEILNGEDPCATEKEMLALWQRLQGLDLANTHSRFQGDSGPEIVEYLVFKAVAPFLLRDEAIGRLPLPDDINATPQMYLYGLGDVPGEVFKAARQRMIFGEEMSWDERFALWSRAHLLATDIGAVINFYVDTPPAVINLKRFDSFKYVIARRVRDMNEAIMQELAALKREQAMQDAIDCTLSRFATAISAGPNVKITRKKR